MSYSTVNAVVSLFRNLDITQTDAAVVETEIEVFLEDAKLRIDTRLRKFYRMPITVGTNPESVKVLAVIEKYFAAQVVDEILNNNKEQELKANWEKRALQMLEEIAPSDCDDCKPIAKLPDAEFLGTSADRGSFTASTVAIKPVFVRGKDNW